MGDKLEGGQRGTAPVSGTAIVAAEAVNEDPDWSVLIASAASLPLEVPKAKTFHKGPWASASKPVCVKCSDGIFRVLKGRQAGGRMLFNDQVVARLAQKIGAPVPKPAIVDLPKVLVDAEPSLKHMTDGLCHGSEFLDGHSDRQGVAHHKLDANRSRFALLAILYGWMYATDHQQIYPNTQPHLVVSVDHGHFIGDGPEWTPTVLEQRPVAQPDGVIVAGASLTRGELSAAARCLTAVAPEDIARSIAAAPDVWGVPMTDRLSCAQYIWRRRNELLAIYPPPVITDAQAQGA